MESPQTLIPLGVRLQFSRAAVQVLAARRGIRLLHIKGDALDRRIRPRVHPGGDVDVLVDPRAVTGMHTALIEAGWRLHTTFLDGSPFGHAQTYHHPDWGFLDLHRRFPGIRIADQRAFALLWRDRGPHEAVGITCAVPSGDMQLVLFLLNAARDMPSLGDEALAVWGALDEPARDRVRTAIRQLRADVAFAVVMGDLDRYRWRRETLLWRTISGGGGSRGAEWAGRILAAPTPVAALQTVVRAPLANRSRLARKLGRPPTARDLVVATGQRLATVVRRLRYRSRR